MVRFVFSAVAVAIAFGAVAVNGCRDFRAAESADAGEGGAAPSDPTDGKAPDPTTPDADRQDADAGVDAALPPPTNFSEGVDAIGSIAAHWRLDETTLIAEDRADGNNGESSNSSAAASLLTDGGATGARRFANGGALRIQPRSGRALAAVGPSVTVGAAIRADDFFDDTRGLVEKPGVFALEVASGIPQITVVTTTGAKTLKATKPITKQATAEVHFVVGTYDATSGDLRLTVDDARYGPLEAGGPLVENVASIVCIGSRSANGDCYSFTFLGTMDEVFIASTAATRAQIADLRSFVQQPE